jgi:uncharacterized protein (UPF0297 family)
MEGRPEPLHLHAFTQDGVGTIRVALGDETVVVTNSTDLVADTIRALKMKGVDHSTQIIIYGVSNNPAYNGAIKHHGA